jgi:pyruvate/2-oxoglutarate/acetoin dehydrogenase E1 component
MKYFDELKRAMDWLGEKPDTLFLGQAVEYAGTAITNTLKDVSKDKLLEMPVNEDMHMGMTLGMALNGRVPISIFPRWNFLLLATNQLINNIDKYSLMTGVTPHIIIRVGKGSDKPLDPGHQHKGNYIEEFKSMLKTVEILDCQTALDIQLNYEYAIKNKGIYLITEYPEKYYN